MCLRLLRNFVRSKVPRKRSKMAQANVDSKLKQELNDNDPTNNTRCSLKEGHNLTMDLNPEAPSEVQTDKAETLSEEDELRQGLLDALPPVDIHEPFDIEVNPTRAYLSALPLELKLEILDQFVCDYSIPSGGEAYRHYARYISQNNQNVKSLKAMRLCDRQMSQPALHRLFIVANLTPDGKSSKWLTPFENDILPLVAQHIKYIVVYLDEENDEAMAHVLRQLSNVKWVMVDLSVHSATSQTIEVLRGYTGVTRFTTISSGPFPIPHMEANISLLNSFGRSLVTIDLFNGWSLDQSDTLLRTIQDSCLTLENIYVYGTSDTCLALMLVGKTPWASRATLKSAHFEACKEIDAWIVASLVQLYPALQEVDISSCGGPGDYDNARGRDEERENILKLLKPINRPPLSYLRIVHATDVEFRHMCSIPTKKLVVFDPLDQMLFGELISNPAHFPGMEVFELQYMKEIDRKQEIALKSIKAAIEQRGGCQFADTRKRHMKDIPRGF